MPTSGTRIIFVSATCTVEIHDKEQTDLVEEIAARGHLHEEVPCGEVSSPLRLVDGELCSTDELEDMPVLERGVHPTLLLHGLHLPI